MPARFSCVQPGGPPDQIMGPGGAIAVPIPVTLRASPFRRDRADKALASAPDRREPLVNCLSDGRPTLSGPSDRRPSGVSAFAVPAGFHRAGAGAARTSNP